MKKGISLISLIITIIVVVILSAFVIFAGFEIINRAGLAKFTHEYSDYETAILNEYMLLKQDYAIKGETKTNEQIYAEIAGGPSGDIPEEIAMKIGRGKAYKIVNEIAGYKVGPDSKWGEYSYITNRGEIYLDISKAFEYEDGNGEVLRYISSSIIIPMAPEPAWFKDLKVGDYVNYVADAKNTAIMASSTGAGSDVEYSSNATWRIWSKDEQNYKLELIQVSYPSSIRFNGVVSLQNMQAIQNQIRELYTNQSLEVKKGDVRLLSFKDLIPVTTNIEEKMKLPTFYKKENIDSGLICLEEDGRTIRKTFVNATNEKPINMYMTYDGVTNLSPIYLKVSGETYSYPELINHGGFVRLTDLVCRKQNDKLLYETVKLSRYGNIYSTTIADSKNGDYSTSDAIGYCPIISLGKYIVLDENANTKNMSDGTTAQKAWNIKPRERDDGTNKETQNKAKWCENINIGDYINYMPTQTSISIDKTITGTSSNQNYNAGTTWRVWGKNEKNGTLDLIQVSEPSKIKLNGLVALQNYKAIQNQIRQLQTNESLGVKLQNIRLLSFEDIEDVTTNLKSKIENIKFFIRRKFTSGTICLEEDGRTLKDTFVNATNENPIYVYTTYGGENLAPAFKKISADSSTVYSHLITHGQYVRLADIVCQLDGDKLLYAIPRLSRYGNLYAITIADSLGGDYSSAESNGFCPIVTIGPNLKLDDLANAENLADGTTKAKAWNIKLK